jgi:hypothetical protein
MFTIARILGLLILDLAVTLGTGLGLGSGSGKALPPAPAAGPADANANASAAYQKLTGLAGRWEADSKMGKVTTTFEIISGGSALLERFETAGMPPMVTVYHLDGSRLVLEHYCHAGNQPKLQARPFQAESNEIDFDFVSATNLSNPQAGHMHQLAVNIQSADRFSENWIWSENGKVGARNVGLDYHRVQ